MHALLFELDSIQNYLFASGRLRDVAGASELLDSLTSGDKNLLDSVCKAAGIDGKVEFSRRAGGAFYAFSDDRAALEALLDLWTLAAQQYAPGLAYSLGMGEGNDAAAAFDAARKALMADGSRLRPRLPQVAPVTERTRRTGEAAEHEDKKEGKIDAASQRRKRFADLAKASFLDRYAPDDAGLGWRDWPRNLEPEEGGDGAFPFARDDRTVALVHADGNGLGQLLIRIKEAAKSKPDQFVKYFERFSKLVETITRSAAKAATEQVLLPAREGDECLAARPILLGGDDITVLVRADLALSYCKVFSDAFELASREELEKLTKQGITGLPERLTLGFGVVYMRASQPFYLASHLAESLIAHAKKKAKAIDKENPPASLAFHRVTSSLVDDYEEIVERELTHHHKSQTFIDTLGVYFLSDGQQPALTDLEDFVALLGREDMARGPTRQLMTLMGYPGIEAEQRYRRWRQLMEDKQSALMRRFDALLSRLAGDEQHGGLPYARKENDEPWRTPLGDALALMGAGHAKSAQSNQKEDAA